MARICASLLILAVTTSAVEALYSRTAMEGGARAWAPSDWKSAAADSNAPLRLLFALRHDAAGTEALADVALAVSDPARPETYGKHLSGAAANALVAPTGAARVTAMLRDAVADAVADAADATPGNVRLLPSGDWVEVVCTVAHAERLLQTRFGSYASTLRSGETVRLTRLAPGMSYSLPADLAAEVSFVAPTLRFPAPETLASTRGPSAATRLKAARAGVQQPLPSVAPEPFVGNGSIFVTPGYLRELYRVGNDTAKAGSTNTQCVASFIQQFWSSNDLQEFEGLFAPWNRAANVTISKQIGKNNPKNPGAEANLDVQYLTGVAALVDTWVWYTADPNTPFLTWLVNVSNAADDDVPRLFSVSYGEYENGDTTDYMQRVSTELSKLAARGVTVLVASGDNGAGGNCTGPNGEITSPDFPATSPWVTTVGGVIGGDTSRRPMNDTGETVDFISGGGFSTVFDIPSWQQSAVSKYLSSAAAKLPKAGTFNPKGRGYPDVAAQSESFIIVEYGVPLSGVGGTSCATPSVGGLVSLLNERRNQAGKASLGFLNPLLCKFRLPCAPVVWWPVSYAVVAVAPDSTAASKPRTFNDVTTGANAGCDLFGLCVCSASAAPQPALIST